MIGYLEKENMKTRELEIGSHSHLFENSCKKLRIKLISERNTRRKLNIINNQGYAEREK